MLAKTLPRHTEVSAQMIDEVHTLIGAGAAEGAIDAANILKPALARGELQCIGATTLDEYRKHIEKDPALERRFQPVKMRACRGLRTCLYFMCRRACLPVLALLSLWDCASNESCSRCVWVCFVRWCGRRLVIG